MDTIVHQFWSNSPWIQEEAQTELECRFGYMKPLTRTDYDNAMKKLRSIGFHFGSEQYLLRVVPIDGDFSLPNRIEICDTDSINNYIDKKQSIIEIINRSASNVRCQKKEYFRDPSFNSIKPVFVPDYNFKVSYTVEKELEIDTFLDCFKKHEQRIFRVINRITMRREDYPFIIDFSIVYTHKGTHFQKSAATKTFEIEIEVDNKEIQKKCPTANSLLASFRKLIVYILCGIQQSNFHISITESDDVLNQYYSLVRERKIVGLNCQTIQIDSDITTSEYCVTEKADGERHLMYISKSGKIYLIQSHHRVIYTGCMVKHDKYRESLLDGELILHSKDGVFINMFAIFDVLFVKAKDVRRLTFSQRFLLMKSLITDWKPNAVVEPIDELPMIFLVKRFMFPDEDNDVYKCCNIILDSDFMYDVDGLILTPVTDNHLPVFKWKSEKQNTIDFIVRVLGEQDSETLLELHCGYTKDQLKMNPKTFILNSEREESKTPCSDYTIKLFVPTNPYDEYCAYTAVSEMKTPDGEQFYDQDIVEFAFIDRKWVPIRVRKDKTTPNNFKTANSNWTFIHFPVTEAMIRTKISTDKYPAADLYYNRGNITDGKLKQNTRSLCDFHNIVKRELLGGVIKKAGGTLFDFGCGKGGDLHKWIYHKVKIVFGIDSCEDNIVNTKDGCYARYLPQREKLLARFVHGDATKDLLKGEATVSKSEFEIWSTFKVHEFDVASCQFAMHYFFKSNVTLKGFLINLYNVVKVGGFFVGCCFDGSQIFEKLKTQEIINCNDAKGGRIWMLQKKYKHDTFVDDVTSLGYKITVYQESINSFQDEYLVNFDFFTALMEQIGFFPVKDDGFEAYYDATTIELTETEKEISFLNRAFVFQKKTKITNPEALII